jgi:excisionase family DNA binding protein
MNEYLTIQDVMKILSVSRTTAYGYIRGGRLKFYKIGRLIRITREDLEDFVRGHRRRAVSEKSCSRRKG